MVNIAPKVGQALAALGALTARQTEAQARVETLAQDRQRLAYAAAIGDGAAKKELASLTAEAGRHGLELENLAAAIDEAKRRLEAAEHDAAAEVRRGKAREALPAAARLRDAGQKAGAAIVALGEALGAVNSALQDVRRCGLRVPSFELMRANLARSIQNELSKVRLADILPPSQRVAIGALMDGYARELEAQATAIIDEGEEAA